MTVKTMTIQVEGHTLTFFHQRSPDWTHPYAWEGRGTLKTSGCGIFALCHAAEWLTGNRQDPEYWADFSCACGGRGDDGTDRPQLLHGLMVSGRNRELGFSYVEDGLRNDTDVLYDLLAEGKAAALCNLRPGHIVVLVAAREANGVRQVLAIDSHTESIDPRVRNEVTEVIPGTEITYPVENADGVTVGSETGYAAYWARLSTVRDFNILHII